MSVESALVVIFSLEGGAFVGNLERIVAEVRLLAPVCCAPAPSGPTAATARSLEVARGKATKPR